MNVWRCGRCGTLLREVIAKTAFTKHVMCTTCKVPFVVLGDCIRKCESPVAHVGLNPQFLDARPARKPIPRPAPATASQA